MYIYLYIYMFVCLYIYIYESMYAFVCVYIYICVCVCVCMCVCIFDNGFFVRWYINFRGLFKAIAILLKEQQWYYWTHTLENEGIYTISKVICLKVNELAYFDSSALIITPRLHHFIYIYIYICVCVCVYIYIYVCVFMHIPAPWYNGLCSPMIREIRIQSLVESYQRLKKWYLMPSSLKLGSIRYGWRVSGLIQGMKWWPSLLPGVVTIEKIVFGSA